MSRLAPADRTLAHRQHATHTLKAAHPTEVAQLLAAEMARLDDGTRTYKEARSAAGKAVSRTLRTKYPDEWREAIDSYTSTRGQKVDGPPYKPLGAETRALMLTVCGMEPDYQQARKIGEALGLLESAA